MAILFVPSAYERPQNKAAIQTLIRKHVNRKNSKDTRSEFETDQEQPWLVTLPTQSHTARITTKNPFVLDATSPPPLMSPRSDTPLLGLNRHGNKYPVFVDTATHTLISVMYTDAASMSEHFDLYRECWLPLALHDATAFQQIISMFASYLNALYGHTMGFPTSRAISYHSRALNSVRDQLSNNGASTAASDGVVATVIGFACHANLTQDFRQSHAHMQALSRILELRGGLRSLHKKPLLRLLLFFVDVFGSLAQDIKPYFPIPIKLMDRISFPKINTTTTTNHQLPPHFKGDPTHNRQSPHLISLLAEFHTTTSSLSLASSTSSNRQIWHNSIQIQLLTNPLTHRLLSWCPSRLEEQLLRLACLLFLSNIRRRASLFPIQTSHLVTKLHEAFIIITLPTDIATVLPNQDMRIWILTLAAVEVDPGSEQAVYFLTWLAAEMEKMETAARDRGEIVAFLERYVSCGDVFNAALYRIADDIVELHSFSHVV